MVRIKICGLTRPEDALLSESLGAYALGFILTPVSKRFNPPGNREWISSLSCRALKVGVFQDQPADLIIQTVKTCRLDRVQLHGRETADLIGQMPVPVWKALTIEEALSDEFPVQEKIEYYLIDSGNGTQRGGTGVAINPDLLKKLSLPKPRIIAGGIRPETMAVLLDQPGIDFLDINSGIETAPGLKDPERLRKVFEIAGRY